jgi:hypothetical protein
MMSWTIWPVVIAILAVLVMLVVSDNEPWGEA